MRQYAASPVIQTLVADRTSYFATDWQDQFYDNVWNVDTAKGFGLDIWGRIVVIGRDVITEFTDTTFGYYEAWAGVSGVTPSAGPLIINPLAVVLSVSSAPVTDDRITPFNDAPFYDGIQATKTITLSDEAYRKLILAKALANISDCTIPSLNKALRFLFDGGPSRRCYATTSNLMDLSFIFEFELTPVERTLAVYSGVIPRPAGVKLTIVQVDVGGTFGFAEADTWQPFDHGVFFGDDGVTNAV